MSATFEGMADGDRQHLVWGKLLEELGDREQEWVEFVFTEAPCELDEDVAESKGPGDRVQALNVHHPHRRTMP